MTELFQGDTKSVLQAVVIGWYLFALIGMRHLTAAKPGNTSFDRFSTWMLSPLLVPSWVGKSVASMLVWCFRTYVRPSSERVISDCHKLADRMNQFMDADSPTSLKSARACKRRAMPEDSALMQTPLDPALAESVQSVLAKLQQLRNDAIKCGHHEFARQTNAHIDAILATVDATLSPHPEEGPKQPSVRETATQDVIEVMDVYGRVFHLTSVGDVKSASKWPQYFLLDLSLPNMWKAISWVSGIRYNCDEQVAHKLLEFAEHLRGLDEACNQPIPQDNVRKASQPQCKNG